MANPTALVYAGRDRSQTAPQMLTAPGERRIVGGGEVEAHHPEQGVQEPFGRNSGRRGGRHEVRPRRQEHSIRSSRAGVGCGQSAEAKSEMSAEMKSTLRDPASTTASRT